MMAARGQTYGKAGQQMEAQRAAPMRKPPTEQKVARPMPAGSLFAPTARPNEPITAGAPFGPGPGPAAAGIPMITPEQQAIEQLRQIAVAYQLDDLLDAVDAYGDEL